MVTLEKYLTPEQVAEHLQLSLITIKKWLAAGELPAYKVGRQWRISATELEEWIKRNK